MQTNTQHEELASSQPVAQTHSRISDETLPPFLGSTAPDSGPPLKSLYDWEALIGGKLALWVGALCLFLALASFLVYIGKTLPPPPPKLRVASGFIASFTLIAFALAARLRGQRWFVDGLLGTGLAVGFLSVWGAGPHFALWSPTTSVLGFGFYAVASIAMSARRNSPALLVLGASGGFLTPLFVHYHNAHGVALPFSIYLLVLNAGIVAVCAWKKWREVVYAAFGATVLLCFVWAISAHIEGIRLMLWTFASLGWALFAGAACFGSLARGEQTDARDATLLVCATGVYTVTSQWLLAPLMHSSPGAFTTGLALVVGALWLQTRNRTVNDELLGTGLLSLACALSVVAMPLQFGQGGLVWGWMAQSVVLLFVARKAKGTWLRNLGRALWCLALLSLAVGLVSGTSTTTPFDDFSLRLLFCLGATALALWSENEREWSAFYDLVLAAGSATWIARTLWLVTNQGAMGAGLHHIEATLLLESSALALWALCLWQIGWWRREVVMRFSAWALLMGALSVTLGLGIQGEAVVGYWGLVAFATGLVSLVTIGFWHARHEAENGEQVREIVAIAGATWTLIAASLEVLSHSNGGHFTCPALGATSWFTLGAAWSVFAAGTGAISLWRAWPKMWALAESAFAVAVVAVLFNSLLIPHALTPILNARLGAFVITALVAIAARHIEGENGQRRDLYLLLVLLLPLWALTQELWNGAEVYQTVFGKEWQRFASLGISLGWSFYAMACLLAGVARRAQNLRIGALVLGALAVCKVFLLDLAFLDSGLRILSLAGLGASLLFISWLYSRLGRIEHGALG